jgi:hypothetical protein
MSTMSEALKWTKIGEEGYGADSDGASYVIRPSIHEGWSVYRFVPKHLWDWLAKQPPSPPKGTTGTESGASTLEEAMQIAEQWEHEAEH